LTIKEVEQEVSKRTGQQKEKKHQSSSVGIRRERRRIK
jgi:hypothetical protein